MQPPPWPIIYPEFSARCDGGPDHMQGVRARLCAVRRPPHRLLQAVRGQGRQGGRQGAAHGLRRVRQGVSRKNPPGPILLGRVPPRGQEAAQPRSRSAANGRPRESSRRRGAHEGGARRPQGCGGEEGERGAETTEAPSGWTPRRTHATRRGAKDDHMQAVRAQLWAVRRNPRRLLQAMRSRGRQGGRPDRTRTMQGVRQGVFHKDSQGPILLGRMPCRRHPPHCPRVLPQAHGRPRGACQGGGAREGVVCRP